jgi:hypothetical protein
MLSAASLPFDSTYLPTCIPPKFESRSTCTASLLHCRLHVLAPAHSTSLATMVLFCRAMSNKYVMQTIYVWCGRRQQHSCCGLTGSMKIIAAQLRYHVFDASTVWRSCGSSGSMCQLFGHVRQGADDVWCYLTCWQLRRTACCRSSAKPIWTRQIRNTVTRCPS